MHMVDFQGRLAAWQFQTKIIFPLTGTSSETMINAGIEDENCTYMNQLDVRNLLVLFVSQIRGEQLLVYTTRFRIWQFQPTVINAVFSNGSPAWTVRFFFFCFFFFLGGGGGGGGGLDI